MAGARQQARSTGKDRTEVVLPALLLCIRASQRTLAQSSPFESRGYFRSSHDVELEETGASYTPVWKLDDNHSLVAESSEDNAQVRDALRKEIFPDGEK